MTNGGGCTLGGGGRRDLVLGLHGRHFEFTLLFTLGAEIVIRKQYNGHATPQRNTTQHTTPTSPSRTHLFVEIAPVVDALLAPRLPVLRPLLFGPRLLCLLRWGTQVKCVRVCSSVHWRSVLVRTGFRCHFFFLYLGSLGVGWKVNYVHPQPIFF